ncbi:MAG: hemolysin family protein [Burkholderiaceae bacterium]|nr:hemolysin family protein [Burkholderiaceae bacterium]
MELIVLMLLILLNGAFAMSEIALLTARRARLQRLSADGDAGAAAALRLGATPTRFLSTVQIGITSIGILNGIVGESVFARPLAQWMQPLGVAPAASETIATALVVVLVTYLTIVLGELAPKRIGQIGAETIARRVARPMELLATVSRPIVRLLTLSTNAVLRLLGQHGARSPGVTEEEIHALLDEGSDSGVIERNEHAMVRNVFRLDDRQIGSLMVPRGEIATLDASLPIQDNIDRVAATEHTRYPVVRGSLGDIVGVVNARRLLLSQLRCAATDITADLEPATFVPETLTAMELLENFRSTGSEFAFVVDEYGDVLGIVTPQDLIEAITGEFRPQRGEDAEAVERDDGSWLLDGLIPIPELCDRLGLRRAPQDGRDRFHTLGGMVMLLLGRLPRTGDRVEWDGWTFEVVDLDGRRVDKVLASRISAQMPRSASPQSE